MLACRVCICPPGPSPPSQLQSPARPLAEPDSAPTTRRDHSGPERGLPPPAAFWDSGGSGTALPGPCCVCKGIYPLASGTAVSSLVFMLFARCGAGANGGHGALWCQDARGRCGVLLGSGGLGVWVLAYVFVAPCRVRSNLPETRFWAVLAAGSPGAHWKSAHRPTPAPWCYMPLPPILGRSPTRAGVRACRRSCLTPPF